MGPIVGRRPSTRMVVAVTGPCRNAGDSHLPERAQRARGFVFYTRTDLLFVISHLLIYCSNMAGHSHWAGIKHKKGAKDAKRGVLFSKLLAAVSIAAKTEQNPQFNPRLRTAVEKAKEANVPQDNIARAIQKAADKSDNLEEIMMEAYGPGGTAILIEAITDNRNRTTSEMKHLLSEIGCKWAEPGSVLWAFELRPGETPLAKFPQKLSDEEEAKLRNIVDAINEHDDVQKVTTNSASTPI